MSVFDDPGHFGRLWADTYDEPGNPDPTAAVAFLADLAGDGRVLELAIGTGRVALALAARGPAVEGVEASPEMVGNLRAKPGGDTIPVAIGDMADVPVSGPYRMAYLVFNTLFNLVKAERQADCFRNVARVLEPGGAFVIEAFVPDPADFDRNERVQPWSVTEDSAAIRLHRYDREAQTFLRQTVTFDGTGVHLHPFAMRYMWPHQIDELAERAGFCLAERYADWDRTPFGRDSTSHVSVYRLG
ncbi:class I SAM-dependent methyltransferase [Micromonospora sp. NPDC051296]|uniref:class I SAM-dependent methyltransferase n=1 Tax=Micromonospora sp. NPDC051296 TaxID=3155046 RepID=UPI0034401685